MSNFKRSDKLYLNKCIYCGNEFKARTKSSFCCKSLECLKIHSHKVNDSKNPSNYKFQNKCEICGELFSTNNKKAKVCSDQCSGVAGIRGAIKKYGEPQYFEITTCINCGTEFQIKKGSGKNHKYCKLECKFEYKIKLVKKEMLNRIYGKLVVVNIYRELIDNRYNLIAKCICECGKIHLVRVDVLRDGNVQSCGCLNWKGGITPIKEYLRSKISPWKVDSTKASNYKCIITSKPFDDIHHLYPFHKIIDEVFNITNIKRKQEISEYTAEELKILEDTVLQLHYKYPLGVCLTHEIHSLFHSEYGRVDFTPKNFYEFKEKYLNGNFDTED
jgi:hypothetical protein